MQTKFWWPETETKTKSLANFWARIKFWVNHNGRRKLFKRSHDEGSIEIEYDSSSLELNCSTIPDKIEDEEFDDGNFLFKEDILETEDQKEVSDESVIQTKRILRNLVREKKLSALIVKAKL